MQALSEAPPSKLASLSIKLVPTAPGVVGDASLEVNRANDRIALEELDAYFSRRVQMDRPRLGHLQIVRALLMVPGYDEAYFEKYVDSLEVIG